MSYLNLQTPTLTKDKFELAGYDTITDIQHLDIYYKINKNRSGNFSVLPYSHGYILRNFNKNDIESSIFQSQDEAIKECFKLNKLSGTSLPKLPNYDR